MGVTDWGEINQPLGAPALGGAGGWADSVAQALNNSDTTVDARLATLEVAMEALIDAADANADGRVAKTGDTMTGPLTLPDGDPAASTGYVDAVGEQVANYAATLSQGNVTFTSDWNAWSYSKVGNLVQVDGVFRVTNSGQAGSSIKLVLPITPWNIAASLRPLGGVCVHSAGGGMYLTVSANSNIAELRQMGQAGVYTTQMTPGQYIICSFSYLGV